VGHGTKINRHKAKAIKASLRAPVRAYLLQPGLSKAELRRLGEGAVERAAAGSDLVAGECPAKSAAVQIP
jgi:hypothetical protein